MKLETPDLILILLCIEAIATLHLITLSLSTRQLRTEEYTWQRKSYLG